MLVNQESVTKLAIKKLIVNNNGALTDLFDNKSSIIGELPVAVIQNELRNGRIHQEARLHPEAIGLQATMNFRFISINDVQAQLIHSSNSRNSRDFVLSDFQKSLECFITRAKESDALNLLALRYVRNITNGQWLKSNNTLFDERIISVKVDANNMQEEFDFVDHEVRRKDYDNYDAKERKIADYLVHSLLGEQQCSLSISAKLYGDQPYIYASQNPTQSNDVYLMIDSAQPKTIENYPFPIIGESLLFDRELRGEIQSIDTWGVTGTVNRDGFQ